MGRLTSFLSLEGVTRASWARGLEPAQWETLLRQAAHASKLTSEQLESQVTAALLLLVSEAAYSPSPTTLAYLRHSVNLNRSSSNPPLVRPGFLARQSCFLPDASLETLDQVLAVVNAALSAGGEGAPAYAAKQPSDVLEGIAIASSLIITQLSRNPSVQTPTLTYIDHFLSHLPLRLKRKELEEESIERCVAALIPAINALATLDSVFLQQLLLRLSALHSLIASTPPLRFIPLTDLNESTTSPDPDISLLVSSFLVNTYSPFGSSSNRTITSHLAALLRYRIAESPTRGGTPESALSSAFLELLLAAMEPLRSDGGQAVDRSFVYSRLPEVLSALFANGSLASEAGSEGLQGCLESALRKFKILARPMSSTGEAMDVDGSSPANSLLDPLLVALYRQELISLDAAASLGDRIEDVLRDPWVPQDFTDRLLREPDDLNAILSGMATDYAAHRAISSALQVCIETHTHSNDLSALAPFCTTLSAYPDVLAIAFLYIEPHALLSPVREFLEAFDRDVESFDEGHPIERYGAVTLFLELTLSRFSLYKDLPRHLGTSKGFFAHWLPSASAVYDLPSLDEDAKAAVQGWVGALFGEGISDELMHSTDPRVLLRVAPTICKQSLAACQAGVIDLDTLREGLSYFLQELLSFTLPGVLRWLVAEIHRVAAGPAQETMIEILQVFVFSESLPRAVLELVRSDLESLVAKFATVAPPALDLSQLAKLLGPSSPLPPSTRTSPLQQLLADLTTTVVSPPTASLSHSLLTTLSQIPSPSLVPSLVPHLLSLVPTPPLSEPSWLLASRLRRLGSTILASPSPTPSLSFPLLEALVRSHLPPTLRTLAGAEVPEDANERARIEMLAEMVAGAFWLVRGSGGAEEQVQEMGEALRGFEEVGREGMAGESWWMALRGSGMGEWR